MAQPEVSQLEGEVFYPSQDILDAANVKEYEALYQYSLTDPEGFWAERAEELEYRLRSL